MASKYRKISVGIWNDAAFRSYSDKAKLIFFMLLTHPHTTPVGALRANVPGLACEMGWDEKGFREGFREVLSKGRVKYDERASLIWLPRFLKHNAPENPNVFKSWIQGFKELPECQLKCEIDNEVKAFVEGLSEGFREVFRKGWPKGMPNQEQEQEQDTGEYKYNSSSELPAENLEAEAEGEDDVDEGSGEGEGASEPEPAKSQKTFDEDSEPYRVALFLFNCIAHRKPDFKRPNLQAWARHADLMLRVDKRELESVQKVIRWCQADPFWQSNILSTAKLREKFDQLDDRMKSSGGCGAANSKQGTTCTGQPRFKGFDHNSERKYENDPEKLRKWLGDAKYEELYGNSVGNGDESTAGQQ